MIRSPFLIRFLFAVLVILLLEASACESPAAFAIGAVGLGIVAMMACRRGGVKV